jgi:hypothetical protein
MPKELEEALKRKARQRFGTTTSKEARAYIYGALRKTGWKPKKK